MASVIAIVAMASALTIPIFTTMCAGSDTNVAVDLQSRFPSGSIRHQAAEYFASISKSMFWSSIEGLSASAPTTVTPSHRDDYHHIMRWCSTFSTSTEIVSTLNLSLALNAYSPLLESNRKLLHDAILNSSSQLNLTICEAGAIISYGNGYTSCGFHPELLQSPTDIEIFEFDHLHPNRTQGHSVVVYGNLDHHGFLSVHEAVLNHQPPLRYVLRLSSFESNTTDSFSLNGFGVELSFKNMEYNVLDDQGTDDITANGTKFDQSSNGTSESFGSTHSKDEGTVPSKDSHDEFRSSWDLTQFGFQAVQHVKAGNDSLVQLEQLACNFPRHAVTLKSAKVASKVVKEISAVHTNPDILPGENVLTLNGIAINIDEFDIFSFQTVAVKEASYIESLAQMGLSAPEIDNVLQSGSHAYQGSSRAPSISSLPRLDTRSDDGGIIWMNDLESGHRYRNWPHSLSSILQMLYPGQLVLVGLNFYTCIAVVDPTTAHGLSIVAELKQYVENNAPIRVGIVFDITRRARKTMSNAVSIHKDHMDTILSELPSQQTSKDVAPPFSEGRVANLVAQLFRRLVAKSKKQAFSFLTLLLKVVETFPEGRELTDMEIRKAFLSQKKAVLEDFDQIVDGVQLEGDYLNSCERYISERNIEAEDIMFLNGAETKIPYPQLFQQVLYRTIFTWQNKLMQAVHSGVLTDPKQLSNFIFGGDDVVSALSQTLQTPTDQWIYISELAINIFDVAPKIEYLSHPESINSNNTIWVYADLDDINGASLAFGALRFLLSEDGVSCRIAIFASGQTPAKPLSANAIVSNILLSKHPDRIAQSMKVLALRLSSESDEVFQDRIQAWSAHEGEIKDAISTPFTPQNIVELPSPSLIVNGRILNITKTFLPCEFKLLKSSAINFESISDPNAMMRIGSVLGARSRHKEPLKRFNLANVPKIHYPSSSCFKIVAILSPLSEACQQLVAVLLGLRDHLNWDITLVLNPPSTITAVPIKRYYRYVFQPKLAFDADGCIDRSTTKAHFSLPSSSPVMTLSLETIEPWLVESSYAQMDLDNMQLEDVCSDQQIAFDLKYLLVYGTCLEVSTTGRASPPAGLKLLLGTSEQHYDTVVMENVGYFQLKSSPHICDLKLASARANEIFMFATQDTVPRSSTELIYHQDYVRVPVRSFTRSHLELFVQRRPGMEGRSLVELTEPEDPGNAPNFWSRWFPSSKGVDDRQETIHIFSIASGHLYERFLRIMMLSVAKRMSSTKYKLKFWFVGQFLSPQFKTNIQDFAEKYGFSVELVIYKWPHWLRRQREKQRIIWGYKILFLDVLFPIQLDRIIFIDADQIVRGDISELWNLDLKGNPYAYTPFCDSNTLTEGFRFWKGGFWRDHLRGKPYHISALYVVDLKQFRKVRAGDTLRAIYENLSADPNSLSNLDQDLPNYSQHVVGIYSLPQEWLWCDAWCSMESLEHAKTIDLCNNPMTKEPKLIKAKRLLPEWIALNEEANPRAHLKAISEEVVVSEHEQVPTESSVDAVYEKTEL